MAEAVAGARGTIRVEVAYARPDVQVIIPVELAEGATLADALLASGLHQRFVEIDPETATVGVFGKLAPRSTPLHEGDRVEVYRPLIADPKAVRRQRAAEGKRTGKGGGNVEPGGA